MALYNVAIKLPNGTSYVDVEIFIPRYSLPDNLDQAPIPYYYDVPEAVFFIIQDRVQWIATALTSADINNPDTLSAIENLAQCKVTQIYQ